jgi:UDP-N-acetylmuramate dehydrogenase
MHLHPFGAIVEQLDTLCRPETRSSSWAPARCGPSPATIWTPDPTERMTTVTLDIEHNAAIPTWFRVGGRADRLARPRSLDDLRAALELDPDALVLGDGANLIVADGGVRRLVIDLAGLNATEIKGHRLTAHAGARLPSLVNRTARAGLAGFHTLAGVPASIGGAVMMNAGGAHGQIADTLTSVTALTRTGDFVTRRRDEIAFGYRTSGLAGLIITEASFDLTPGDPAELTARVKEIMHAKKASQPLADRSAGCCFKNPVLARDLDGIGHAGDRVGAGLLIDRAGCKSLRIGSAEVSPLHANFITTGKDGRADDVIRLLDEVRERVRAAFGVELEREVMLWGEPER